MKRYFERVRDHRSGSSHSHSGCAQTSETVRGSKFADRAIGVAVALGVLAIGGVANASDCPIIESRNWMAWIDRTPGVDAEPTLHVAGLADLPTPGYVARWELGPADRRAPPAQTLTLEFDPPTGATLQVIEPQWVSFDTPAIYEEYRAIRIVCGDQVVAEITEIDSVF